MKKEQLHSGHRARMRQRWREGGPVADHELLEMLLYHAIPRQNTNDLAHRLIEIYGDLSGVLGAGEEALRRVEGVGESTATLLALAGEAARRYAAATLQGRNSAPVLHNAGEVVRFIRPYYVGVTKERAHLLLFDNSMHLLDCSVLGEGSISRVMLPVREILMRADRKGATAAILVHNHPHGLAVASQEDLAATRRIAEALDLLQITLLEHIILNETSYMPILKANRRNTADAQTRAVLGEALCQRVSDLAWEVEDE